MVDTDISIVKLRSTFTPKPNADAELEKIIKNIEQITVRRTNKSEENLSIPQRDALNSLVTKVNTQQIVIKSADKGDITVIMSPTQYKKICLKELNKAEHYQWIGQEDPSPTIKTMLDNFCDRHKAMLTPKEYDYLVKRKYDMANFYVLPKLHKCSQLHRFLNQGEEYVHLPNYNEEIEGRPIVGGPAYYTSGVSEMLDIILKPIVSKIPHILRDSFDLIEKCEKSLQPGTVFSTADIKALYTNLSTDLVVTAIQYWVEKYRDEIPLLQRFNLLFIIEALRLILDNNFFYFFGQFIKQILGFAMGTKAAVQCANLAVAFLEVRMFALLPSIYPRDFVDFIIRNYFRFLDDVFHLWLKQFDITAFYEVFENLDPNLKYIFSQLATMSNFLDILFKNVNNVVTMDVYHKPTDSFNFLHHRSCHPLHTKDNIALSLGKRIVNIVTGDYGPRLDELKKHLVQRGHHESTINRTFTKIFQPKRTPPTTDEDVIVFTETFNPRHSFDRKRISNCLQHLTNPDMRKAFNNCKIVMGTRQPKSLRNMLIRSKFSPNPLPTVVRERGFFNCSKTCNLHRDGFLQPTNSIRFGRFNEFCWNYSRRFDCDAKNVIYLLICNYCWEFYIGETDDMKQRARKHKSDVFHPENSNCTKLMQHLRECSKMVEPFFKMYPFYYVDDQAHRRFVEKRWIKYFRPPLNIDSV